MQKGEGTHNYHKFVLPIGVGSDDLAQREREVFLIRLAQIDRIKKLKEKTLDNSTVLCKYA